MRAHQDTKSACNRSPLPSVEQGIRSFTTVRTASCYTPRVQRSGHGVSGFIADLLLQIGDTEIKMLTLQRVAHCEPVPSEVDDTNGLLQMQRLPCEVVAETEGCCVVTPIPLGVDGISQL